jgi:hypothetical protein
LEEQAFQRESRWERTKRPHSYDPATGLTYVRWFWHPRHLIAAAHRLKWWYWGKRGY